MTQIKVNYEYEVLLSLLKKEMHGRELAKELKTSLTRIQSILNGLRQQNALDYKAEGRNHTYFIKRNIVAKTYVLNAENYKLAKLLRKYTFLEPLFEDITKKCSSGLIILFGSYAKNIPKPESDIDIYIETEEQSIKRQIEEINSKLSVKIGRFSKDSLLIKEIIKNHVMLKGAERFYEQIFN